MYLEYWVDIWMGWLRLRGLERGCLVFGHGVGRRGMSLYPRSFPCRVICPESVCIEVGRASETMSTCIQLPDKDTFTIAIGQMREVREDFLPTPSVC